MTDRITRQDCERVAELISARLAHTWEGEPWVMSPAASWRTPRLHVEPGSRTYGRAWAVFVTGGTVYGTAHYRPAFGELRSGSARELFDKLHVVLATLEAVQA